MKCRKLNKDGSVCIREAVTNSGSCLKHFEEEQGINDRESNLVCGDQIIIARKT